MKPKPILIILLASVTLLSGILYLSSHFSPLLSPVSIFKLDPVSMTSKLNKKASTLSLDFSAKSKKLGKISSPYYLLYNHNTSQVYASKEENKKIPPASFAKLITAQVVLDTLSPEQIITVTATSADKEPTIMGLIPGEQFSISDLLRGSIATSANDAAATLAEGVAHTYQISLGDFVSLMNIKSSLLKMDSTHFVNPEGFDDNAQYTTLVDLAKLTHNILINYPDIISASQSNNQDISKTKTHGHYYLPNWNTLLGIYPGVSGLKIARTEKSGFSSIVVSTRNNITVVAIVSGATSILDRDLDASRLLDFAFSQEGISKADINRKKLNTRYKEWSDLAKKIRSSQ